MTTAAAPAAAPAAPATPAAPAAASAPAAGAPAANEFNWSSAGLDQDTAGYVQNKGWKAIPDVVTSYRNLEKLTGGGLDSLVKLPKPDADPSEWGQVYDKLGRPAKADDYGLPVPEGDKGEFAKIASGWFHEAGLNSRQGRAVAEKWNAHVAAEIKKQTDATAAAHAKEVEQLNAEWGTNMQANTVLVDRAAIAFGMTTEHLTALKQVMGPAGAMKFMHSIGSKLGVEGTFIAGDGNTGMHGMTAERAQAKINELKADRGFQARFGSRDPQVKADAQAEMSKLHKLAYPETL